MSSRMERVKATLAKMTIEPVVFLFSLSYGLSMVIAQNLAIDKVCRVNLNFTTEICHNLDSHKDAQIEIQKMVNLITMYEMIVASIPGIIISLFVGPWSDSGGRKPLIVAPLIGQLLSSLYLILLTYLENARGEWFILFGLYGLFGGFTCFLTGAFTYVSDISRLRARTARIAMIDFSLYTGIPIGSALSGVLFGAYGYYPVFGASAVVTFINLIFVMVAVKETKGPLANHPRRHINEGDSEADLVRPDEENDQRSVMHYSHVVKVFKSCFKSRPHKERRIILLMIVTMLINLAMILSSITYMYTRLKLGWTEKEYTLYSAMSTGLAGLAIAVVIPFLSFKLKVPDGIIGAIGAISGMAGSLVLTFVSASWMMYLAGVLGFLQSTTSSIIRAILSKVSPSDELGSIFAMLSCLESAVPILSNPALTLLYNSTITTFPGAIYALQVVMFMYCLGVMIYVWNLLKQRQAGYGRLDNQAAAVLVDEEEALDNTDH